MKKIFTSLIAGTVIAAAGIEVKANPANADLQTPKVIIGFEMLRMDISDGLVIIWRIDVAEYRYQVDAIDQNVTMLSKFARYNY